MKKLSMIFVCLLVVGFAYQADAAKCTKTTKPYIKVLSPNGGEFFTPGQEVTVKWESCNVAKDNIINISLQGDSVIDSAMSFTGSPEIYNDGVHVVTIPTQSQWSIMEYGLHYQILVSAPEVYDLSDNLFTIATCNAKSAGSYTLSNSKTPEGGMFGTGRSETKDFHFATISLTTTKTSGPICIDKVQLGSLTDPSLKIGKTYVYDSKKNLLATVPITNWSKEGSSWYAWAPIDLDIKKGGTTVDFVIKADVLDSKSLTNGLFNLGISGMNFDYPGARGYSISFGNIFAVN